MWRLILRGLGVRSRIGTAVAVLMISRWAYRRVRAPGQPPEGRWEHFDPNGDGG